MTGASVKIWITVLLVALAAYGGFTLWRVYQAMQSPSVGQVEAVSTALTPAGSFKEFTFRDQFANDYPLAQLEGKVWVASFFFADCPGVCRNMNATISNLAKSYADRNLTWVSITVDPVRDTPAVLDRYAHAYNADPQRWVFLTGTFGDAERLGQDVFQVTVRGRDHSERLILVDREGNIRGRYMASDPLQLQALKQELNALLGESG